MKVARIIKVSLIFILVFGLLVVTLPNLATTVKLLCVTACPNYPTNPFYNPNYGSATFKAYIGGAVVSNLRNVNAYCAAYYCDSNGNNLYTTAGGTLYVPMGASYDSFTMAACGGVFTSCNNHQITMSTPGLSSGCFPSSTGGYGGCANDQSFSLTGTITGSNTGYLLTSPNPVGDPTCNISKPDPGTQSSGTCWANDYSIIAALPSPCTIGVTACIYGAKVPLTNTTTIVGTPFQYNGKTYYCNTANATLCTKTVTTTTQQIWYVYRQITSLALNIVPPAIKISDSVSNCNPTFNCSPNTDLTLTTKFINGLNSVDKLTGARIAFGVTVPAVAGFPCSQQDLANGNCWFGIVGVWIGGQGMQTSGCTTSNTCTFVQGQHAQLSLFSDPQETIPATQSFANVAYISTLTNTTIAQVTQNTVSSQVYTYIDTSSLGPQYSQGALGSCQLSTLSLCITTPSPISVNVPILYDVIGSKQFATWLTQYPNLPPSGGPNSGAITGKVYDAVSGNPLTGACVSINSACTGTTGQYQTLTGKDGSYTFNNLQAPNSYAVYAGAYGYNTAVITGQSLTVGGTLAVNFYLTQPPNPNAGQACLFPPVYIPNPLPFQPGVWTPGILCVPPWVIPISLVLAALVSVAVIAISPAGQAFAGLLAFRRKT